jgi:membrane protease YdiL (CAAX protease family)
MKNCPSQFSNDGKVMSTDAARRRLFSQVFGFAIVALTMVEMFTVPKDYFVLGSIVSTSAMFCVAFLLSDQTGQKFRPALWRFAMGIGMAFLLYAIFQGGNLAVTNLKLFGVSSSNELSIYGLFSSVPTPLLVFVLALDAIGFESYFRGNLQNLFSKRIGAGSVFVVAVIDAIIHISTMNPLFPATVIVADSIWGLNYYTTKDLYSNIACHFVWDLLVFVLLPIH